MGSKTAEYPVCCYNLFRNYYKNKNGRTVKNNIVQKL